MTALNDTKDSYGDSQGLPQGRVQKRLDISDEDIDVFWQRAEDSVNRIDPSTGYDLDPSGEMQNSNSVIKTALDGMGISLTEAMPESMNESDLPGINNNLLDSPVNKTMEAEVEDAVKEVFADVKSFDTEYLGGTGSEIASGVGNKFTEALDGLEKLADGTAFEDDPNAPKTETPGPTLRGGLEAGAGALATGLTDKWSEENDWSDTETFLAEIGINTVLDTIATGTANVFDGDSFFDDNNSIGDSISDNFVSIGTDLAYEAILDTLAENLGMSQEDLSQTKDTLGLLREVNNGQVGVDSVLKVLNLDDEIGSSAIANDLVEPNSGDAAIVGAVGGGRGFLHRWRDGWTHWSLPGIHHWNGLW